MRLDDIYAEHAAFVWRSLRRLGVREVDADDALQEVFLTLHRALDTFGGRSSLRTWLFAVCRSTAKDRRKRAHVRREISQESAIAEARDSSASPYDVAATNEKIALLEAILDLLPDDEREVFVLFELEGLTGPETAETLSIPLGTAYTRLRSARQSFRRELSARGGVL